MSRSTEELVRAALTARAEQVTHADLTQQLAPPASSPKRWAIPLAAAATVAAAVVGVWLVSAPGADRAAPPAGTPGVSTEPAQPTPSTSSAEAPATHRVTALGLSFDVPIDWDLPTAEEDSGGDSTCVGPVGDPCSGVRAAAAGELMTVEDYFDGDNDTCRRSGPTQVELDHLSATRGDYDCGVSRYPWVINPDPFYSVSVMTETLSQEQLAAVESVRLAR